MLPPYPEEQTAYRIGMSLALMIAEFFRPSTLLPTSGEWLDISAAAGYTGDTKKGRHTDKRFAPIRVSVNSSRFEVSASLLLFCADDQNENLNHQSNTRGKGANRHPYRYVSCTYDNRVFSVRQRCFLPAANGLTFPPPRDILEIQKGRHTEQAVCPLQSNRFRSDRLIGKSGGHFFFI